MWYAVSAWTKSGLVRGEEAYYPFHYQAERVPLNIPCGRGRGLVEYLFGAAVLVCASTREASRRSAGIDRSPSMRVRVAGKGSGNYKS